MSLGKGGMSHGRGIRSSKEGTVPLVGGNSMFSDCWVAGIDIGNDGGSGMLTGSGVSSIGTGGSYCSIDEYSHQCDPQGTRGSGGDAAQGGSTGGGLGGMGNGINGNSSTRGGISGMTGVSGMTSVGRDEDGWMKGWVTGTGLTGGGGAVIGADDNTAGMTMIDLPPPSKGVGLGMNTGDLLLIFLL